MTWFVGIDGGGSRAVAVLTDAAGDVHARAEAGPGRIDVLRPEAGAESLARLARTVAEQGGASRIAALCCALSGAGREPERSLLEQALRRLEVADAVLVTTDASAALQDAFGDGPGILLIAGTGSIAWGRGESGATARAGGWGYLIGDEGSGYAIGVAALRSALRAHDGRAGETALLALALAHATVSEPDDLVRWSAAAGRSDLAAIAPLVLAAADRDPEAASIADAAARDLARHVVALHTHLGPWRDAPRLALTGGLIEIERPLRQRVLRALDHAGLTFTLIDRPVDAARGAARLARSNPRA